VGWTVYGKIRGIHKTDGTQISYAYNPSGQRVSKTVNGTTTWYVRDAQGNTMGLYDNRNGASNWREQHLYGSSRLGTWDPGIDLNNANGTAAWDTIGKKSYELVNHLGNVMATITDKRLQHSSDGSLIDYFDADVQSAQEYYAFGSIIPGRTYSAAGKNYRYGFNGKENDDEVKKDADNLPNKGTQQDYGKRIYDPRLGKFLSMDPLQAKFPFFTPYQFSGNSPIANVDLDGLENANYNLVLSKASNGKPTLSIQYSNTEKSFFDDLVNAVLGRGEGEISHAVLNYQGQQIALFNSFQEMKQVVHGKTIGQIQEWESNRITGVLKTAIVAHAALGSVDAADEYIQAKIASSASTAELASIEAVSANGGNISVAEESVSLPTKRVAQLRSNNDISKLSEGIVRDKLASV